MTVAATPPVVRYTGTGSLAQFFWSWQMLPESSIEVRVNNVQVSNYTTGANFIQFATPPATGDDVLIFRRTSIWMPENYSFARGFKAEKTELSMDRAYMIAQEYEAGVVGAADLFTTLQADGVTVNSERGKDAFIPLWVSFPPDPSIIWAGPNIAANSSSLSPLAVVSMIFWPNALSGPLGQSNVTYRDAGAPKWTGWIDHENPQFGDYWIRISDTGAASSIDPGISFTIVDGSNITRSLGEEFDPVNTEIKMAVINAIPPVVSFIELNIEISKDDGGVPDGRWASRIVFVALEYFN